MDRAGRSSTLIRRGEEHDPTLVVVAIDSELEIDVPLLNLNDAAMVADVVEERFLR